MQFTILAQCAIILTALLATAQSAPTSAPVFSLLRARDSINDCGDSTFVNQGSAASPTIADCQHLASNIAAGGSWTINEDEQRTLATYGSCAFGVTIEGEYWGYVGNQDIIDVINTSIAMFGTNGLIGSKGVMGCQSGAGLVGGVDATWGIYHT